MHTPEEEDGQVPISSTVRAHGLDAFENICEPNTLSICWRFREDHLGDRDSQNDFF